MDDKHNLPELVGKLAAYLEKSNIDDYILLLNNPKKLFFTNFLAGLARGIGMALGFTILGALLITVIIYFLRQLVMLNLPVISDFIASIVRMVMERSL